MISLLILSIRLSVKVLILFIVTYIPFNNYFIL